MVLLAVECLVKNYCLVKVYAVSFISKGQNFGGPKSLKVKCIWKGLVRARQLTRGRHPRRRSRSSRRAAFHRSNTPSSLHTELHYSLKHTHIGRVWLNQEFLRCWCTKADKWREYNMNALLLNESETEDNCSILSKSLYPGLWCFRLIALVVDGQTRYFWKEEKPAESKNLQKQNTQNILCSVIVPQAFREIIQYFS